ncbi:MAG: DNA gyrase inhibitor YacG [Pseudomonadota bacterium]
MSTSAPSDGPKTGSKTPSCPVCGRTARADYRPFCSKRCADIDLNRWLKGGYAIPAAPDSEA